jgi:iron(III) transport system substrate-binding protein
MAQYCQPLAAVRRGVSTLTFVLAAFVVGLSGCARSSERGDARPAEGKTGFEQVFSAIDGLHGKRRTAKLLQLAKRDGGELSFYTSLASGDEEAVADGFADAYGIDVAVYRANTEAVAQRLVEEARAGFHGADVVDSDGVSMFGIDRESLLVDYRPDGVTRLVLGADQKGWTVTRFNTFVVSWNTKRVGSGERPQTWEDLADPRWKGRLAMEFGDLDWYGTLRDYWISKAGKSEAEADRLFAQMGRNALVVQGHTLMAQLLAAGEFDVAASSFAHGIDGLGEEGAPVAWRPPVEPVIVRTNGVGLVRGARHPAAAVLFVEWLINEGQNVIVDLGREPARKDLVSRRSIPEIRVNYSALVAHQAEWTRMYERVLSGGTELTEGG